VEVILHGTQYRKMHKAFGGKVRITERENGKKRSKRKKNMNRLEMKS